MAGILGQNTKSESSILDEDNMISDSPIDVATQQSIKAYVDEQVQKAWHQILSSITAFGIGDSDGDGNGTKITINDVFQKISIVATDIELNSSAVVQSEYLFADGFKNIITKSIADIYDLDPTPAADHTVNGRTMIGTAGENLVFGDIVYLKSDGKFWLQDADAEATADGLIAMATATIAADATGTFLLDGFARDDSWAWTVGGKIFLDDFGTGNLSQTVPSDSGDIVRIAGYAYSADVIYFNPDNTYLEIA